MIAQSPVHNVTVHLIIVYLAHYRILHIKYPALFLETLKNNAIAMTPIFRCSKLGFANLTLMLNILISPNLAMGI